MNLFGILFAYQMPLLSSVTLRKENCLENRFLGTVRIHIRFRVILCRHACGSSAAIAVISRNNAEFTEACY